ncbi:HAD family hydrolase [Nocardia sp. NPDC052566]|uniref:HAD family hydrolase n=1 Tax=Nocardia sp. NPDC052566 TaxID=3364330 RepID=UPI0037C96D8E
MAIVAFFDVDQTLISVASMYRFLESYFTAAGTSERYRDVRTRLAAATADGVPREELNRVLFRALAGEETAAVREAGRRWFAGERDRPGFYHPASVGALARHRRAGHRTVLVSGSFPACLAPIADALGVDAVLSATPEHAGGRFTGEIDRPMIGAAKAVAAQEFTEAESAALDACWAYGDHESDLQLLAAVGNPVVVGDDPLLAGHAARLGWRRLAPSAGFAALDARHSAAKANERK